MNVPHDVAAALNAMCDHPAVLVGMCFLTDGTAAAELSERAGMGVPELIGILRQTADTWEAALAGGPVSAPAAGKRAGTPLRPCLVCGMPESACDARRDVCSLGCCADCDHE